MDRLEKVKSLFSELSEICPPGYAMALHISFTTPRYLFQTYNKEWMEEYSRLGLVMYDPNVRWGLENDGMVSWTELAEMDPEGVIEKAAKHGLRHGMAMATSKGGSKSVAGFGRSDREFTSQELSRLTELLEEVHVLTQPSDPPDAEFDAAMKEMSLRATHG